MDAGTSSTRMIVASSAIATANPTPIALVTRICVKANEPATMTMIRAALVMMRPVLRQAEADRATVVAAEQPLLAHAREQEDLVVHRDAEDGAEHEHRQGGVDDAGALKAEDALEVAVLEDEDEAPKPREQREGVDDDRLERQPDAAQQQEQHHVGHDERCRALPRGSGVERVRRSRDAGRHAGRDEPAPMVRMVLARFCAAVRWRSVARTTSKSAAPGVRAPRCDSGRQPAPRRASAVPGAVVEAASCPAAATCRVAVPRRRAATARAARRPPPWKRVEAGHAGHARDRLDAGQSGQPATEAVEAWPGSPARARSRRRRPR